MLGPVPFPGRCGIAETDLDALGAAVLASWDAFLDVARSADLTRPSRLPGWSGADTCIHLGDWDDHRVLAAVEASARSGGVSSPSHDADADNARLVGAHRDASPDEVLAAVQRSRDALADWFVGPGPAELGLTTCGSAVGPLPLLNLLHAAAYELAVHALDLAPCGAPHPPADLLDRGLAALLDVTGALSARAGIDITVTAQTPAGGWAFTSAVSGWTTQAVPAGHFDGVGVRGSAADLLDASAGRAALPLLLVSRRLVVQQLPSFLRLAPLVSDIPGLPGGAALRAGVGGLGAVTGGLGRRWGRFRS